MYSVKYFHLPDTDKPLVGYIKYNLSLNQGCGSSYFSNASASTPITSASASTNKKQKNDH